ncbi:hypothetical protein Q1695_015142 [Nippostrongylus brasiliensis]|nr:hypothetical protein Q1695_015142 [Nippostrongylus brasiliensis]
MSFGDIADVGALLHPDIFVQTDPVLRDFCEQKDAVDPLSKMNSENTDDRVVRSFTPTPVLWSYNDLQSTSFSSAGDGDDTFFDAEDGCSSCSVSGDKNAAWLSSKSRSEHESVKYDCRTCDNLGDGTGSGIATGPKRHKRKRSASCNDVGKRRNSIFAWSTGSALEMRLCSRLTFELIEGPRVPCGSEPFSQRCIIENVHDDLRCGSRSTIVSWLPGRAAEADTSRRTFKVHLRKNVLEESALYAPYPLTESLQNLKLAHPDGPTKDDCPLRNKPTQPEKISMTISRAEVKKECIRLWGSKVKKLEELLLFLQLFHRLHGPVLITECEELLESCAAQGRTDGELSWEQYGEDMDVRRFFEMKMFTMSEPPNRMKVQPVDIILNAGFRILPSGLPSALYNYMVCSRRAPVSELLTSLEPFLKGLPNLKARLDKILLAARMIPDAIVEVNEGLELVSDHEFFVVTDIN